MFIPSIIKESKTKQSDKIYRVTFLHKEQGTLTFEMCCSDIKDIENTLKIKCKNDFVELLNVEEIL